jgi:hypothetical protein
VEGPLPHAVDREKGWREGASVCQCLNRKSREADLVSDAHLRVCRHHELDPCTGVAMDPHVVSNLKRSVGEGVGGGADLHFSRGVPHCLAIGASSCEQGLVTRESEVGPLSCSEF